MKVEREIEKIEKKEYDDVDYEDEERFRKRLEGIKNKNLERIRVLKKTQKDLEEKEETRRDGEIERLESKEDSQVIFNGPCTSGLEDKEEDFEGRDEKVDEGIDERLEAIKVEKERNKNRI